MVASDRAKFPLNRPDDDDAELDLVAEDTDGRRLFEAASRYDPIHRRAQTYEGVYLGVLLLLDFSALIAVGVGGLSAIGIPSIYLPAAQHYSLLALGGLLGGLVYSAKWLYHSIAKGLWHQDRQMWRFLAPWISVGTTIGIWALIGAGFFPTVAETSSPSEVSSITPLGIGFLVGYLSDRFLAKMKELTQVLFGQTEQHYRQDDESKSE